MNYKAKFAVLALGSAFALSACGSSNADADGDGEVSADEAEAALSDVVKPQPGKYKATIEVVSLDIPGAPPEMTAALSGRGPQTSEACITEEMAEQGFGEALKNGQDESCTITKLETGGGKLDMVMSCNPQGMGEATVSVKGDISSTKSDVTVVSEGSSPLGEGRMEMKMSQERIGDCDA